MTKVVHLMKEPYDVAIDRNTIWGNPYTHQDGTRAKFKVDTREEAVAKYREYILNKPELLEKLGELKNKTLGCWCKFSKDVPCHGDVLIQLIEEKFGKEE
jgi:hypothetical protein